MTSTKGTPVSETELLPCDVMVAPATIIRKGCSLATLLLAISRREGQPTELVTWNTHPGHPVNAAAYEVHTAAAVAGPPEDKAAKKTEVAPVAKRLEERAVVSWDLWYDVSALETDLRRRLSFHDLRRLGQHAVRAFKAVSRDELNTAAQEMLADHMTSEKHHPGYVLVPTSAFNRLAALLKFAGQ